MNFELLPNEIILDLFEYLSLVHLFRGFFDLNSRFNKLLDQQFQRFHLDFRLISKTNLNHACQNYVSSVIDRIISLHLSNVEDTPFQIEFFLSHHYQLCQFTSLQSISLSYLRSQQILDRIMIECSYLPSLTHLTFTNGHVSVSESDAQYFSNQIWSLSKLRYCHLDICFPSKNNFPNPSVVSTSLRHLHIQNIITSLSTLSRLYQYTPYLQHLSMVFRDYSDQMELSLPIPSITRLRISFYSSIINSQRLLKNMSNLYNLTWKLHDIYINGNQWEEMIKTYLPKLKIFQMKMTFSPLNNNNKEIELNQILDSFRTKFWITEHQWFVRCHWYIPYEQCNFTYFQLFTLPYAVESISNSSNCILAQSTRPRDDEYLTFVRVINFDYPPSQFTGLILSRIRFCNIQSLSLIFPFDKQFFSIVSKLDRLTSLNVYVDQNKNIDDNQSQLQLLLDRAPNLYSINFCSWLSLKSQVLPIEIRSISVRRLNLQEYIYNNKRHYFDEEECIQLSRSSLGIQCETLLIYIKRRKNILDLVNNMPKLQILNVHCADDHWTDELGYKYSTENETIEWLRRQLPSSCTIATGYCGHGIRLWIR